MGRAKKIIVRPISATDANRIIKSIHYSGKTAPNSQIHFGVFLNGRCGGAMQFGPSLNGRAMLGLVRGTKLRESIELNRMAFADWLPRNSESRALGVTMRLLRKSYNHMKWVISFADATQCGDGAIYRASGFVLTGIKQNSNLVRLPDGRKIHRFAVQNTGNKKRPELGGRTFFDVTGGRWDFKAYIKASGATVLPGFQLRYIYFLRPECRKLLTVPEIPFERIAEIGAGMYRGKKRAGSIDVDAPGPQPGEGGANPTPALQPQAISTET